MVIREPPPLETVPPTPDPSPQRGRGKARKSKRERTQTLPIYTCQPNNEDGAALQAAPAEAGAMTRLAVSENKRVVANFHKPKQCLYLRPQVQRASTRAGRTGRAVAGPVHSTEQAVRQKRATLNSDPEFSELQREPARPARCEPLCSQPPLKNPPCRRAGNRNSDCGAAREATQSRMMTCLGGVRSSKSERTSRLALYTFPPLNEDGAGVSPPPRRPGHRPD